MTYIGAQHMHPEAFSILGLDIRWYGIMAAVGLLCGWAVAQCNRKHANLTADQTSDLIFWAMLAGVVGARIFYVFQFWHLYRNNLFQVFRVDKGGLVFYGGFLCALLVLYIYCYRNKISYLKVLDIFAPTIAVGHAFGRIGCFLNGCCYGKPCSLVWGISYPAGSEPAKKYLNNPLHPVQLYESIGNLILAAVLLLLIKRLKKGQTAALYLILYGILRFSDEFFRGDHEHFFLGIFTPAQTLAMILVPVGVILFIYLHGQKVSEQQKKENGKQKT